MLLGIDIGTSKTAAVLVEEVPAAPGRRAPAAVSSRPHAADIPAAPGRSEQDPAALLRSVREAVAALPAEARGRVSAVGLTGQMHGVLLLDGKGRPLGPLVTWQDGRCLEGALLAELASRTGRELRSGFGCATLAWLVSNGKMPAEAAAAATVHDWIAADLCGVSRPVTDPTDAASWGLFDLDRLSWDAGAVRAAGLPEGLLPEVVACGAAVGAVSDAAARLLGIPAGIPVAAALGDNQASIAATLAEPEAELALTLGTGGQLSAVQPSGGHGLAAAVRPSGGKALPAGGAALPAAGVPATWELRPYPGGRLLAVAAGLCGGSAWKWLAESALAWMRELGGREPSIDEVYARLNLLGAAAAPSGLVVRPHFLGERHEPRLRGSIEGLDLMNFGLGPLARALADGICENLRDMLPAPLRAGRLRLVASGNALERNPLLRQAAERAFGLPLEMGGVQEAAAVGAALNAAPLAARR